MKRNPENSAQHIDPQTDLFPFEVEGAHKEVRFGVRGIKPRKHMCFYSQVKKYKNGSALIDVKSDAAAHLADRIKWTQDSPMIKPGQVFEVNGEWYVHSQFSNPDRIEYKGFSGRVYQLPVKKYLKKMLKK